MPSSVSLERADLMAGPTAAYLAQIQPSRVEVYRDDSTRVDAFDVPPGVGLRLELANHGWRPTGRRVSGRGWGVILVEPIPDLEADGSDAVPAATSPRSR